MCITTPLQPVKAYEFASTHTQKSAELTTSRPNLAVLPLQKAFAPSSLAIFRAQSSVPLYLSRAVKDCMRVLTVSNGIVVYTVMMPASAPMPNVVPVPKLAFGLG
jgi:hypothetical protein